MGALIGTRLAVARYAAASCHASDRPRRHNSRIEIRQTVGDALLFCGEKLEYSRPPFTMGERSISLLLHYVDRNFAGKLF